MLERGVEVDHTTWIYHIELVDVSMASASALPVITNSIDILINIVITMPGIASILRIIADTITVFIYKIVTITLMPVDFDIIVDLVLILVFIS